jgi:hypothetical protein
MAIGIESNDYSADPEDGSESQAEEDSINNTFTIMKIDENADRED